EDSSDALAARLSQALNWLAAGEEEQYRESSAKERFQKAKAAAENVLRVYENRLGPIHPHSLICRLNIATALCLSADYSTAEAEAQSAAEGLQDRLGADHPYTLSASNVLPSAIDPLPF